MFTDGDYVIVHLEDGDFQGLELVQGLHMGAKVIRASIFHDFYDSSKEHEFLLFNYHGTKIVNTMLQAEIEDWMDERFTLDTGVKEKAVKEAKTVPSTAPDVVFRVIDERE